MSWSPWKEINFVSEMSSHLLAWSIGDSDRMTTRSADNKMELNIYTEPVRAGEPN